MKDSDKVAVSLVSPRHMFLDLVNIAVHLDELRLRYQQNPL